MRTMQQWWRLTMVAGVLIVGAGKVAPAQDQSAAAPLDRKVLDQRVYDLLKEIINTGADLYNGVPQRGLGSNPQACYHLYQGALITLAPLLDHRPSLQRTIGSALAEADSRVGHIASQWVGRRLETDGDSEPRYARSGRARQG